MAKKISKSSRKPKVARSSSIQRTIQEGRDYVTRADRRVRIIRRRVAPQVQPKKQKKVAKTLLAKKVTKATKPRSHARAPARAVARTVAQAITSVPRSVTQNASRGSAPSAPPNNQIIIEQELQDRLGKHKANIGKLNFSLRWWDPNDLDLHVICPCNTEICYYNKKCTKCGGELDIDMNMGLNMSLEPVQHIYFNKPKSGLYKFYVQYFNGPKEHLGVKGTEKSKYALSLHEDMNQIFRYEDTVSVSHKQMHYDFNR